jgi:4'-phosphopantetheinyl transferase
LADVESPIAQIQSPEFAVEVKLWLAQMWDVDEGTLQRYKAWFSPEEHRRYERFLHERRRREYIVGRGLARRALARELACPPEAVQFDSDQQGRLSAIPTPVGAPVHFNITHTADYVGCATCWACEVGLDVEKLNERVRVLDIAERFFSRAESQALQLLNEAAALDSFVTLWTLKEALAKAHGLGLAAPLESSQFKVNVDGTLEAVTTYPPFASGAWLACCSPTPMHRLSLCVLCPDPATVAILPQEPENPGDLSGSGFSWATGRLKNI